MFHLNDVVFQESKVAAAEHGIGALRCVIANTALARIQLVVNNAHPQSKRFVSEGHIKNGRLESREEVEEP